jgi:hypothetical protein
LCGLRAVGATCVCPRRFAVCSFQVAENLGVAYEPYAVDTFSKFERMMFTYPDDASLHNCYFGGGVLLELFGGGLLASKVPVLLRAASTVFQARASERSALVDNVVAACCRAVSGRCHRSESCRGCS